MPQDPLKVLKQALDVQTEIEQQNGRRNADGGAPATPASSGIVVAESKSPLAEALKPAMALGVGTLQEIIVDTFAKGDPAKAAELRSHLVPFTHGFFGPPTGAPPMPTGGTNGGQRNAQTSTSPASERDSDIGPDDEDDEEEQEDDEEQEDERAGARSLPRPKVLREVLAQLDDDEAERFDTYLDDLDEAGYGQLARGAHALKNLDERVTWVRSLLTPVPERQNSDGEPTANAILPDVPQALRPVIAQLSAEEVQILAAILVTLDRATAERMRDNLIAMPMDKALATVRRIVGEAQRRSASVAQRAVAAAFSDENAATTGGAP